MADQRPLGHPAAGIPPGRDRSVYSGRPTHPEHYKDGPDTFQIRHVSPELARPPVDPWVAHAQEIAFRMTGLEVDAVRVVVRSNDVQRRALLELRVEYVGGIEDACAWLSLFAPAPAVLRQLTQGQAPPDAALRPPWKLPLVDRHGASAPAVLIWRNRSLPIECGTFAVGLFRDVLGISDPTRITVRWDEAEPTVVHDRTAKVGMITRASPKGKVLGTCEKCRRDLRDPYYAAVGIGPECIKSYPAKQIQLRKRINRAVREERAVHPNAKRPAVWLSAAKSTWGLDHHGR